MTRKLPISSKKYATPLTIELAQPIHPVSIVLGVHALAALAVLNSSLPLGLIWAAIISSVVQLSAAWIHPDHRRIEMKEAQA